MSEVVRLYQYKSLLVGRRAMSAEDLMARLEISRATLKRDIAKLRDQLHVPIEFDRDAGGYTLSQGHTDSELPGLWFNQEELLALVTIQQLLDTIRALPRSVLEGFTKAFRKRFQVPIEAPSIADRICQQRHHDWIGTFLVSHREVRSAEQHQRPGDR